MQSFNFSSFLDLFSTYYTVPSILSKLIWILAIVLSLRTLVDLIIKNTRRMFPTFDKRVENMNTVVHIALILGHLVFPFLIAIVAVNMSVTALDKKYHNDNIIVLPATTMIARNKIDEYTVDDRNVKPVVVRGQRLHAYKMSLVDMSAQLIELQDLDMHMADSYRANNIVELPLDKADMIQTGDRVTTAKKTLHIDYTGKKAFKLHVIKIERPASADETQWHTVYKAK